MVIKKKIFSTRSKLIILLVIFIILTGYVVFSNLPPAIEYVNPNDVTSNPELYLNKNITVKGYLDKNDNISIITNTMDSIKPRYELRADNSKILDQDNLQEGKLYYFTGVLNKITEIDGDILPVPIYIFYSEKYVEV